MAMASIIGEAPAQNFEYGDLYITLGLQRAARYALRSPYGSELLGIIADMIKALRADGDDLASLLSTFTELVKAVSEPTAPVVIEFTGIGMHQVADCNGDMVDEDWIAGTSRLLDFMHPSNGGTCFDLRLKNFDHKNVARIYRLDQLSVCDAALVRLPSICDNDLETRIRCTADQICPSS